MPDMLVKLYDLPDEAPALARSHAFGVEIRRAMAPDQGGSNIIKLRGPGPPARAGLGAHPLWRLRCR